MIDIIYNKNNPLKICLLPGDGIGPEVISAALPVLKALNIPHKIFEGKIGWSCWKQEGNPIPQETWDLIDSVDTVLLGAITSKPFIEAEKELPKHLRGLNHSYVSPVIQLRQRLKLFANIRPINDFQNKNPKFNFCIIRENTEGLYAGFDFAVIPDAIKNVMINNKSQNAIWTESSLEQSTCSIRLQTRQGLERLYDFAFKYAGQNGYDKVTLADKPNVLRASGAFARNILSEVALKYPDIKWDIQNVDAVAMQIIRKPHEYNVIVAENMFGDILSDLGAGIMGGLGLAPSANLGNSKCYFEPVHGSAPKYTDLNKANPCAMFLTIALMLDYYGFKQEANNINIAVKEVLSSARCLTYDLGGSASTTDMANAIIDQCINPVLKKTISIIATGNELVQGKIINSNSSKIAQNLLENSIIVRNHVIVSDDLYQMEEALKLALEKNEAVIICGGLGPTSDDQTRFAVSNVLKKELVLSTEYWNKIQERLKRFNIFPDESNKVQALMPLGSKILPNDFGTAPGCIIEHGNNLIVMLPGPPRECLSMFETYVINELISKKFQQDCIYKKWRLLGAIESEIAPRLEMLLSKEITIGYCWSYPYLDVYISSSTKFEKLIPIAKINSLLSEYFVSCSSLKASEILKNILKTNSDISLFVTDNATKGRFLTSLLDPKTVPQLMKSADALNHKLNIIEPLADCYSIAISGLDELWNVSPFTGTTSIKIEIGYGKLIENYELNIPYRSEAVVDYALEFACHKVIKTISKAHPQYKQELPK